MRGLLAGLKRALAAAGPRGLEELRPLAAWPHRAASSAARPRKGKSPGEEEDGSRQLREVCKELGFEQREEGPPPGEGSDDDAEYPGLPKGWEEDLGYVTQDAISYNAAGPRPAWTIEGCDDETRTIWFGFDTTGGKVPFVEQNALLSQEVKHLMHHLHDVRGFAARDIADFFRVREQRVLAVVALKRREYEWEEGCRQEERAQAAAAAAAAKQPEGAAPPQESAAPPQESAAPPQAGEEGAEASPAGPTAEGEAQPGQGEASPAGPTAEGEAQPGHGEEAPAASADGQGTEAGGPAEAPGPREGGAGSPPFDPGAMEGEEGEARLHALEHAQAREDAAYERLPPEELADIEAKGEELFEQLSEDEQAEAVMWGTLPGDQVSDRERAWRLEYMLDCAWGADELLGTGERHINHHARFPAFEVGWRSKAAGRGEGQAAGQGPPAPSEGGGDGPGGGAAEGEPGAGQQQQQQQLPPEYLEGDPAWGDEVEAREEARAVREFRQALDFNLGLVGQTVQRRSRAQGKPRRPPEGWSLVVRPARGAEAYQPFVAQPDATRRELTADEQVFLERRTPKPRRRRL